MDLLTAQYSDNPAYCALIRQKYLEKKAEADMGGRCRLHPAINTSLCLPLLLLYWKKDSVVIVWSDGLSGGRRHEKINTYIRHFFQHINFYRGGP